MPHIIPHNQTQDDLLQRTSDIKHEIEERSFLVTVRSQQRAMPRSCKKRKAKRNSETYIARACKMDVASYREISRIQKLDNDKLKANVVRQVQQKRASDEWKGFWSRAVTSGRKKIKKKKDCSQVKRVERKGNDCPGKE